MGGGTILLSTDKERRATKANPYIFAPEETEKGGGTSNNEGEKKDSLVSQYRLKPEKKGGSNSNGRRGKGACFWRARKESSFGLGRPRKKKFLLKRGTQPMKKGGTQKSLNERAPYILKLKTKGKKSWMLKKFEKRVRRGKKRGKGRKGGGREKRNGQHKRFQRGKEKKS